ncbi:hypothetical protein PHYBOEH_006128 [Phytophthora boehmeriae]|uniref:Helicase-associated domain-containing protein n=1 Tax=Phytophthora boehmeriae TaxID=109152 RepID=A0A8T1WNN3_9STRA|nr:hypothetical protein PHYBOEH_006128 [Phytophthora boehmeriae]
MRRMKAGLGRFLSTSRGHDGHATLATALRAFYEQNQHFVVPYRFQVPSDSSSPSSEWPQETRGFKLGREVRKFVRLNAQNKPNYLQITQQLKDIGFPEIQDWKKFYWEQVEVPALRAYKHTKGDLLVPRPFVVPQGDVQWPRATWGTKLGVQVNTLRSAKEKLLEYQIQDLDKMGFVWVVSDYVWDKQFMPALRRYREIYGHAQIQQSFVVGQDGEEWQENLRGYRLGKMVNRIRTLSAFGDYVVRDQKELEELGFWLSSYDHKWQTIVLPAFKTFHSIYGHCHLETDFVVPEEEPWSPEMWGMRLGYIANNIRSRGDYFRQIAGDMQQLEDIGFVWNVPAAKWKNQVIPALTTFVHVHGHSDVPPGFVVPSHKPWPEMTWGFRLGVLVEKAARRKKFSDFIEIDRLQLESLGFFWSAVPDDDSDYDDIDDDYN